MENESSIKQIINNALQEVRAIMDADTIVGQPIPLQNGTTVIPISKVSMGFASGGLDLPAKQEGGRKNFGGGGGTGVSVVPVGFLTAYADGRVEFLAVKLDKPTTIEQVADLIQHAPDIVGRMKKVFTGGDSEKKRKEEAEKEETIREVERNLTNRVLESMETGNSSKADARAARRAAREEAKAAKKKTSFIDADED